MNNNITLQRRIEAALFGAPDVPLVRMIRDRSIDIVRMDNGETVASIAIESSGSITGTQYEWAALLSCAPHLLREALAALRGTDGSS